MGPEWKSQRHLREHFRDHRRKLGLRTLAAYDRSAKITIEVGTRFNYRDRQTGEWRIGYYDRTTERFAAFSVDEQDILSHFRCPEWYVAELPRSDYT
jgi:hypothetical protein